MLVVRVGDHFHCCWAAGDTRAPRRIRGSASLALSQLGVAGGRQYLGCSLHGSVSVEGSGRWNESMRRRSGAGLFKKDTYRGATIVEGTGVSHALAIVRMGQRYKTWLSMARENHLTAIKWMTRSRQWQRRGVVKW